MCGLTRCCLTRCCLTSCVGDDQGDGRFDAVGVAHLVVHVHPEVVRRDAFAAKPLDVAVLQELADREVGVVAIEAVLEAAVPVVDDRYRGFQHSFDRDYADLSIGKLLQYRNIEWLCGEGIATYDLGMHMDYKVSYTDRIESTITLIVADTTR